MYCLQLQKNNKVQFKQGPHKSTALLDNLKSDNFTPLAIKNGFLVNSRWRTRKELPGDISEKEKRPVGELRIDSLTYI